MVAAGNFNRRVVIQRPVKAGDDWGQSSAAVAPGGWTEVATVWADVRHLSGVETVRADASESVAKASIRIRYRTGLDASMRVVLGAQVYAITAVLPDERRREYIDLACKVPT